MERYCDEIRADQPTKNTIWSFRQGLQDYSMFDPWICTLRDVLILLIPLILIFRVE
jgi:hypothetical protein